MPVVIYSEIDDQGWQTRKVEVLPSGIITYASAQASTGNTRLSDQPLDLQKAEANYARPDSPIRLSHIDEVAFNRVWQQATA